MKYLLLGLLLLTTCPSFGQLGFCEGSKGDPIFHEAFSKSGPLPQGTTSYTYVSQKDPLDGEYRITDQIGQEISGWFSSLPETTISSGKALVVNADYTAGQFYRTEISGLCENTTYEFSAFLINILHRNRTGCENGGIPVNVRFEIWDGTDQEMLAEGNTGDIPSTSQAKWEQYALTFRSEPGQHSVILKMYNNGEGGCGNDLAIDDIIFRSCGDLTTITAENAPKEGMVVCRENAPVSQKLTASPDHSVYQDHAFQWQESSDNEDWQDIPGETLDSYTTPPLTASRYYRVKVAEDPVNLALNLCSSASEPFGIQIIQTPDAPLSNGDIQICSDDPVPFLEVQAGTGEIVNWYSMPAGGQLLSEDSESFRPEEEGIYYAEAVKKGFSCQPGPRTAVQLEIFSSPETQDQAFELCQESSLVLDAGQPGARYHWNTGETSRRIIITDSGNYQVEVTNSNNCSAVKHFEVTPVIHPEIEKISSQENLIRITPAVQGNFEYSLDGVNFYDLNEFRVSGGIYTVFMRDKSGCATITSRYPHLVVPEFITPNNDGYNDVFEVRGLDYFSTSRIRIFDRYGKILKSGRGRDFRWDGTLEGKTLPADDYWFEIRIEDYPAQKGHFSLLR